MKPSFVSITALLGGVALATNPASRDCHCLPNEPCWPSESEWQSLNTTVHGRLVKIVPIGHVCHDPTYDEAKCADLKAKWDDVKTHYSDDAALMTQYATGQSCDPFTDRSIPCTQGNYNAYTVKAQDASDIVATMNFAKQKNIRFLIRNTGHDFWGRSIGYGGLAVRTADFKTTELLNWNDEHYTGTAFRMGAGVMGIEAQTFLRTSGHVMVAGYCSTVGPAGGYIQGGGHSPLSSLHGLAVDQTLEFEVITAAGNVVKASRTENSDLFFALNGGGAGTWGVILSMTVRVYPDAHFGAATMFVDPTSIPQDTFWAMVDKFYSLLPTFTEQGAYVTYAFGPAHFGLFPFSAYNKTGAEVQVMLKPLLDYLEEHNIPNFTQFDDSDSYVEHSTKNFATSQPTKEWDSGGRLIPREVLLDDARRADLVNVMRQVIASGAVTSATTMHPKDRIGNLVSTHPAWRKADTLVIINWGWENAKPELMQQKVDLLSTLAPLLIQAVPDSASYSNEADIFMTNWQHEMYGENWDRLLDIKLKYDPEAFFYSAHTPGADFWTVNKDGRMCRRPTTCQPRSRYLMNGPGMGLDVSYI